MKSKKTTNSTKSDTGNASKSQHLIETVPVNMNFLIRNRIEQLTQWQDEYIERDQALQTRQKSLSPNSRHDRQIGAAIARQRRRLRVLKSRNPLEVTTEGLNNDQFLKLREKLFRQFAGLTKKEKLLWLNNFEFIMTPQLKKLYCKLDRIRSYRSLGQQRCLLLGGPSGMGKTTCLDAMLTRFEPEIHDEVTVVPIVKIDAPSNNKSSRTLYRRILNALGLSYTVSDSEDELCEKVIAFLDACQVELLIIDEIEHMKNHEFKRKILDLSNQTRGIPIICASCNPQSWTEGDEEIQGRWNDYFPLEQYGSAELGALLTYLEVLLPFSQPSRLDEFAVASVQGEDEPGPASFILQVTKGILRDVMILVRDACEYAITHDLANLNIPILRMAWKNIQETPNNRDFSANKFWEDER